MASEPLNGWSKFNIAVNALGTLAVPIVIFFVGQQYTDQQKAAEAARLEQQRIADEAQHNLDRFTLLLPNLASDNSRAKQLALEYLKYLADDNQFPPEFLNIVLTLVNDEDTTVGEAASSTLTQAVTQQPELAQSIEQAAQTDPGVQETIETAVQYSPDLSKVIDLSKLEAAPP